MKSRPRLYTKRVRKRISRFAKKRPRDARGRFLRIYSEKERKALQAYYARISYHRRKKK